MRLTVGPGRPPLLAWGSLVLAAGLISAALLIRLPERTVGPVEGSGSGTAVAPLLAQRKLEATLVSERPGLCGVRVQVATYARRNTCRLEARLLDGGKVLARAGRGAEWFEDFGQADLYFDRAFKETGRFKVVFLSPNSSPRNAVGLICDGRTGRPLTAPVYLAGRRSVLAWLAANRKDYHQLLVGLVLFLAGGGSLVGLGAGLRARGERKSRTRT